MAPVKDSAATDDSLRTHLRAATMAAHDLLDHAMQAASGWQTRSDYARFLALQYAARVPLEDWLARHAPGDLSPPSQTPLLARDLAALGLDVPKPAPGLTPAMPAPGEEFGMKSIIPFAAFGLGIGGVIVYFTFIKD